MSEVTSKIAEQAKDLEQLGNPAAWKPICQSSSDEQGWIKTTSAMQVGRTGVVVKVTEQQRNSNGTLTISTALTFCPGATIGPDKENEGFYIIA